jgi:hypothetical protein
MALAAALAGCLSGIQNTKLSKEITPAIKAYKKAVEEYDVDGMLSFLDPENFELTIIEESPEQRTYSKDYQTLEAELRAQEQQQRQWRLPPPVGNGYVLEWTAAATLCHTNGRDPRMGERAGAVSAEPLPAATLLRK